MADTAPDIDSMLADYMPKDQAPDVDTILADYLPKPEQPAPETSFGDRAKDVGITALKGAIGVPETAVGLADIPTGGRVGKALQENGVDFKRAKDILSENYSPAQKQAFENVQNAEGFVPTLKAVAENPSVAGHTILESAPSMLGGAGIAKGVMKAAPALSPLAAGAIGEGGVTAGQNVEQVRQQTENGLLTPEQTAILAGSGAATGAITGGFGKIANKLGVGDVNTALIGGQNAIAPTTKNAARRALEGGGVEAAQETAQSGQEQAASNVALGKDAMEGVGNAAALGAVAGFGMGAPTGALTHAQPVTPETTPEEQAIIEQQRNLPAEPADIDTMLADYMPQESETPAAEVLPGAQEEQGFQPPDEHEQAVLDESQNFIDNYKKAYSSVGLGQVVTKRLADAAAKLEIPTKPGDSAQTVLDAMEMHIASRTPPTPEEQIQAASEAAAAPIKEQLAAAPDGVLNRAANAALDAGITQPQSEAFQTTIQTLDDAALTNLFRQRAATSEQKQLITAERERRAQLTENQNALQESSPSPSDGGGSAQPGIRKAGGNPTIDSSGVEPSGQGNGNIEQAPSETSSLQPEQLNDQSQNATPQEQPSQEGQEITERSPQDRRQTDFMSPSEKRVAERRQLARDAGLTDEAALEKIVPKEDMDAVTGFHLPHDKEPTIEAVMKHVADTGETAHFVDADIANLGGLNSHFNNNHAIANPVFRDISDIFADEMQKAGSNAVLIRHGGDELSAVITGGSDASINQAMQNAKQRVAEYTKQTGLDQIAHPKSKPGAEKPNGVGLYLGQSPIIPGTELSTIFERSSRELDAGKRGEEYVRRNETGTAGDVGVSRPTSEDNGAAPQAPPRAEKAPRRKRGGAGATTTNAGPVETTQSKIAEALLKEPDVQQQLNDRFNSPEEAIAHLGEAYGPGLARLVESGVLNFTQGKEGWPVNPEKYSAAEAVYLKGKAFLDINAIPKKRLNAVVLHEIGEHFNLRRMLGTKAYQALQNQITNQAKIPGSLANLTWNKVLNGTDANGNKPYAHMGEGSEPFIAEVIAKLGEYAPQAGWFKRLLSQIKSFLVAHGLGRSFIAGTMTENDLHDLLKASLQSAIKTDLNAPREFNSEVMESRRLHGIRKSVEDFIVPETPAYEGNMNGAIAMTPASAVAKGVERLPIKLRVGKATAEHKGFGITHIHDNAVREGDRRMVPGYTGEVAENYARHVSSIAKGFDQIFQDRGHYVFRSSRLQQALIVSKQKDALNGGQVYSVVSIVPALNTKRWGGVPLWEGQRTAEETEGRTGRGIQSSPFSAADIEAAPMFSAQTSEPAPRFYSALSKAIEKAPEKVFGNAQQVKVWLVANAPRFDVKKDEIYWSGITDWLDSLSGKVTRAQVSEFLDANGVKVEDVMLGGISPEERKQALKAEADGYAKELFDGIRKENLPLQIHGKEYFDDDLYYALEDGDLESYDLPEKFQGQAKKWLDAIDEFHNVSTNAEFTEAKHNSAQLTLPGGTDYRELVVTIPTTEPHNQHDTTHFGDVGQGKQIGWIRHNTRIDANGNKVLFLEEVQSQRSQAGRKSGFNRPLTNTEELKLVELKNRNQELHKRVRELALRFPDDVDEEFDTLQTERVVIQDEIRRLERLPEFGVPPAPFVTDSNNKATNAYISLLMKKAISQAIDNGSDSVAWTTGDQQADRYDLSQHINRIRYVNRDGKFDIVIFDKNDNDRDARFNQTPEQLEEYLGKGVADKILNDEGQSTEESVGFEAEGEVSPVAKELSGLDLKVGGDWTQAMYGDENGLNAQGKPALITQAANEIARKMGGKIKSSWVKSTGSMGPEITILAEGPTSNGVGDYYLADKKTETRKSGNFPNYDAAADARSSIYELEEKGFKSQPALIITPEMKAKILSEGMPMFSAPTSIREAVEQLPEGAARATTVEMLNAFEDFSNTVAKEKLAVLSVRQIIEIAKKYLPGLKAYEEAMQRRRAMVDPYLHKANQLTSIKWKALPVPARKETGRLMQQSTLRDINVSKDWLGVEPTPSGFKAYSMTEFNGQSRSYIKAAAESAGALFSDKNSATFASQDKAAQFLAKLREIDQKQTQIRASNGWKDSNILRRQAYAHLRPAYETLFAQHPSVKDIYAGTYALHTEIFNQRLEALENRIEESILDAQTGAALIAQLRSKFESQSLSWYYAPLKRYGDHWFYGKDAQGEKWFLTYSSTPARDRALKAFIKDGGTVNENDQGTSLSDIQNSQIGDAVSDNFLKDIHSKIAGADIAPDISKALQDEIHQMYLATLPDISVRHNSMHRKGTLGFDEDAMRAFANTIHHGASQLANMTEGREMAQVLVEGRRALDIASRTSLRDQVDAETKAAAMLQANWDELNEEDALETLLAETDDLKEKQVYEEAIKLRRKFGASEDVLESLHRVEDKNTQALEAAKLIPPKDREKAANVLQELTKTYNAMVNTPSTGMDQIASAIRQFDFVMTMGFGLSSGLVNLFQTPVVAMPITAGKYGVKETAKAFGKTRNEFLKAVIGINKKDANGEYLYRDEDGNSSISTIMRQRLDYLQAHNGDRAEMDRIGSRLSALRNFKEEGDVSRTNFFDVLGIGREGEDYGGRLQEFNKKMGWMFHHGERMNREITLMAAYDLALQGDINNHLAAMDYARKVNNDAHGDYSTENAARIFRGPVAGVVMQYKKYPQAMLYLWGKTAADAFSGWKKMPETTDEEKAAKAEAKETAQNAARSLMALFAMQGAAAGLFGMPLMGAISMVINVIGNAASDDDEPWDIEKELRVGLTELGGETFATAMIKGLGNALTPVNLASRMNLSNVFFQEPLKDLEGKDAATEYLSQVAGPFGGMIKKIADGAKMMADGEVLRGVESATPKALGDGLKAIRLAQHGYESMNGEQLKDASAMEVLFQAIGLGSSNMEVLYAERGYNKAAEAAISDARQKLVNKVQKAIANGEPVPQEELARWQAKHPTWPVTYESIHKSVVRTAKNKQEKGIRGYAVNPRLTYLYEQNRLRDENGD
jgi:GGDEF domain-containing protein